jgi:hypothetical protein
MGINIYIEKLLKKVIREFNIGGRILTYGVQRMLGDYDSQQKFFTELGFNAIESIDISDKENPTYVANLNYPLNHLKKYDLVFDGGTMEHCFNVPAVLSNTIELTKLNGFVIHLNPLNSWNMHSFYQFNPTLYYDFYFDNGFSNLNSWQFEKYGYNKGKLDFLGKNKKIKSKEKLLIIFIGQKIIQNDTIIWPNQDKYMPRNWNDVICDNLSNII